MPRQKPLSYILFVVSLLSYLIVGYKGQRHETVFLFTFYFLLFVIYVWIVRKSSLADIKFWIIASILFRLSLFFALPFLSDDFYRFIWDGRLLANGVHPFIELPRFYLEPANQIPGLDQHLFDYLNSKEYFTVYPPFAQIIFWLSAIVFPKSILGSVIAMRVFILAAEIGTLALIGKLLLFFRVKTENILIYALNPLVILELTGNLHFEAFVVFFLLLTIFLLSKSNVWQAGISMGLAICAKLLPLILLPLFLIRMGLRRSVWLYAFVALVTFVFFLPLVNREVIRGFSESLGLYFNKFEFNASVYYLVREYGFYTKGYNTIQTVGWKLGVIALLGILLISLWPFGIKRDSTGLRFELKKFEFPTVVSQLPQVMMWVLFFYFMMTTTLHPWYITTLLMLSVFTHYRFVMVWSAAIFMTYAGYTLEGFRENLYLVSIEYVLVIGYLVYELIWKRKYIYQ